jgi:hypothetical protein
VRSLRRVSSVLVSLVGPGDDRARLGGCHEGADASFGFVADTAAFAEPFKQLPLICGALSEGAFSHAAIDDETLDIGQDRVWVICAHEGE